MKKTSAIPIYGLKEKGKDTFHLTHIEKNQHDMPENHAHRDENYIFFYQKAGKCTIMLDFKKIVIEGAAVFCVLPGQVHYGIALDEVNGWVIAVDTGLVKHSNRKILMEASIRNRPVSLTPLQSELFEDNLKLLDKFNRHQSVGVTEQITRSLLDSYLGFFVRMYHKDISLSPDSDLRPALITRQFMNLLIENFRTVKGPKEYASLLNISPSYLNEVVKHTSGHPVSHWIHQEIILEAKRMLYYTNDNVKEIAESLGYSDVPYFIRLFGKLAGGSPLNFRKMYRK